MQRVFLGCSVAIGRGHRYRWRSRFKKPGKHRRVNEVRCNVRAFSRTQRSGTRTRTRTRARARARARARSIMQLYHSIFGQRAALAGI
jgi:hypothetical protein